MRARIGTPAQRLRSSLKWLKSLADDNYRGARGQPRRGRADTDGMNAVITVGAVLCVPIVIVLTLEVEMRADRWFRQLARLLTGR